MKKFIKFRLAINIITILYFGYRSGIHIAATDTSKHAVVSTEGPNMVLKNEQGKILTQAEAYKMCVTGKYLMVKAVDKNKVPYILVQRTELVDRSHWKKN